MNLSHQTEEEWEAAIDATATVYGLRVGHKLTLADVDAIKIYDRESRRDSQAAADLFHRGYQAGLEDGGGKKVADLLNKISDLKSSLAVEGALLKLTREDLAVIKKAAAQ